MRSKTLGKATQTLQVSQLRREGHESVAAQVEASEVCELAHGRGNILHLVEVEGKDPQTMQLGDAVR
ncbi:hypothetical protein EYF80_002754 [Liparis tanakae]|uniref:Uncharacterized protein n=1 Tax=Liparis tanakae TaxID=230148 RepID=A0A4Z2J9V4_9TELE|nr:hypothetical protein EYF80_002754 [Liparis tanakae]